MNSKLSLLISENRVKLVKLIEDNAPYEEILHQSQLLDKYIAKQMKIINNIKS